MHVRHVLTTTVLALVFAPVALRAQVPTPPPARPVAGPPSRQIAPAPGALPMPADSLPPYVRRSAPTDPTIQKIWTEGRDRSQVAALSQALMDSIGPRLTGSPDMMRASAWIQSMYKQWGIAARAERYGTWAAWRRGPTHMDLIAPRVRSLEAVMLAWSPGTGGKPVEGDVVLLPEAATPEAFDAWVPGAKGKFVLASAPQLSCRSADQWAEFGTPESRTHVKAQQDSITAGWQARTRAAAGMQDKLLAAGAAGVITSQFSGYPGIDKIFGTPSQKVASIDVACEDYGLLYRMAEHKQGPRVRFSAESESLGEQPVFNTIAEIKGSEKPNEYIMLSAHFDSWTAGSGATDNGTGTITMLEAMRILKTVYPRPKRTILVGHWSGEEQGLNGSRAFSEDHPETVAGLQALFNQDNGTGRVISMGPGALPGTAPVLQRYLGEIPAEITRNIRFGRPGAPANGGSDNASYACYGAPAFGLGALGWDYGSTTWHTNRDTYDKIVMDDLKNNATLTAMLVYLASEDPQKMPRDRLDPLPTDARTGAAQTWPACTKALRASSEYRR